MINQQYGPHPLPADTRMPNEIELKLRVSPNVKQTLSAHPAIQANLFGEPYTRGLISIYYDTADLTLLDAGLSLRVRSMAGGWFQAVKSAGHSVGGLHQRLEWEDLLTKNEPDFDKITEPHLANIFASPELRKALKPVFVVDVIRTDWNLKYPDGTEIEVSLDEGEIKICHPRVWEQIEPLHEIEIELKSGGNTQHLFELALAIQKDVPFTIENASKAQRGYSHLRAEPTIKTHSHMTKVPSRHQAPKERGASYISQIQANQEILQKINHTASVSQIRFDIERLKIAIMQSMPKTNFLIRELDWLYSNMYTPCDNAHYPILQETLNSQRYQSLMLNLGACVYNNA